MDNNTQLRRLWDRIYYLVSGDKGDKILNILTGNKELALLMVEDAGNMLECFDENIKDDFDVVATAIGTSPSAINFATERLQHNATIIKIFLESCAKKEMAISNCTNIFNAEFDKLEVVNYFIQYDPLLLSDVSADLKRNYNVVYQAVAVNGLALQYADKELKGNYNVVYRAVTQNGLALEYASEELKRNYDVVYQAITENGLALEYVADELKRNYNIAHQAVVECDMALEYVADEFKNNPVIVMAALENSFSYPYRKGEAFLLAGPDIRNNPDITKKVLTHNGLMLEYVSLELKGDYNIVQTAVTQNGLALEFANAELQNDMKIAKIAVQNNGLALQYVSPELIKDPTVVTLAVENNGMALYYADEDLQDVPYIVKTAICQNPEAIRYASLRILADQSLLVGLATKYARK